MKKDVIFVLTDGFADWESVFLSSLLMNGGFEGGEVKYNVKTLAFTKEPIVSFGGFTYLPDYDTLPVDYAALILIGGLSWKSEKVKWVTKLIADALQKDILIGAICDASLFLAMNGYLNNIKHTSNSLNDLKKYAPDYTGERNYIEKQVIRDGKIVTANGTAYLEFAKEVLTYLEVGSIESNEKFYHFYKYGQYSI
ncbi:glutamine amidotransferase [Dysgonomonas sp. Marseille-P4677]|uniref:type 1 glutamine amidotransferase family protein n=1 Tax=Dysgonomonas sp. Marseille-P4677 TaxID=2364790 RepID=UPI001911736A|nr:type 1 glutamine amidotransferase family protein [Dysgonomonas sp. Marseille-P4677]MBK5722299.1 glutamine amidotransferase [Dysgonomonas sp. Marseille-P4677]